MGVCKRVDHTGVISKAHVVSSSRVELLADGPIGLSTSFAGLDALVPRVIKIWVTSTSAIVEPRTAATAATSFPGFLHGATYGAYGIDDRRRACWCVHAGIGQTRKYK